MLRRWWSVAGLALFGATWRLWTSQTEFPQVPLFGWAGSLPLFVDWLAFGVLLGSLAAAASKPDSRRSWMAIAVSLGVLMVLDQHRLQPWAWQLLLMAIWWSSANVGEVSNLPCIALTISIYFWSAISKLDADFAASHGQTLIEALFRTVGINAANWPASAKSWLAFFLPVGELLVAIGLCWPRTRRLALIAATALHVGLILALGPLGLGHRSGVLLWNVAFIGHDWLLFGGRKLWGSGLGRSASEGVDSPTSTTPSQARFHVALSPRRGNNMPAQGNALGQDSPEFIEALKGRNSTHEQGCFALSGLRDLFYSLTQGVALGWHIAAPLGRNHKHTTSKLTLRVSLLAFACVWPMTERWGLCDRWLAWSVYAARSERVSVTLTDEGLLRLPESARRCVTDGELPLDRWSLTALDVPISPQLRFQFGIVEWLRRRCGEENLVEVIVQRSQGASGEVERLTAEQCNEHRRVFWINSQPRDASLAGNRR